MKHSITPDNSSIYKYFAIVDTLSVDTEDLKFTFLLDKIEMSVVFTQQSYKK
ncbi:hypothetical protein ACFL0J_08750 [Candidatus Neomarinimicrobiota bacterium]